MIGGDEVAQWGRRYPWIVAPYLGGVYPPPGLVPISQRVPQASDPRICLAANEQRAYLAILDALAGASTSLVVTALPGARLERVMDAIVAQLAADGDPAGGVVAWIRQTTEVALHLPATQAVRLIGRVTESPSPGVLEELTAAGGLRGLVLFVEKAYVDHVRTRIGRSVPRIVVEVPTAKERRDYARRRMLPRFSESDADELAFSFSDLDLLDLFVDGDAEDGLRARHSAAELEAEHWKAVLDPVPGESRLPSLARQAYMAAWMFGDAFDFGTWWEKLPVGDARQRAVQRAVKLAARARGRAEADTFREQVTLRAREWAWNLVGVAVHAPAALLCSSTLFKQACRAVLDKDPFEVDAALGLVTSAKGARGVGFHAMQVLLALGRTDYRPTSSEWTIDRLAHQLVGPGRDIEPADVELAFDALQDSEIDEAWVQVLRGVTRTWLRGGDELMSAGHLTLTTWHFHWLDSHPAVPPLREFAANLVIRAIAARPEYRSSWNLLDPDGWGRVQPDDQSVVDAVRRCVEHGLATLPEVRSWHVRKHAQTLLTVWMCDERIALPPEPFIAAFDRDPVYLAFLASVHSWPAVVDPEWTADLIRRDRSGAWRELVQRRWEGTALDELVRALPADPSMVLQFAGEVLALARAGEGFSQHVLVAWAGCSPAPFRTLLLGDWASLDADVQRFLLACIPAALQGWSGPGSGVVSEIDAVLADPRVVDESHLLNMIPALGWRWGNRPILEFAEPWVEHPSPAVRRQALEWLDCSSADPVVMELVRRALADDASALEVLGSSHRLLYATEDGRVPEPMLELLLERFVAGILARDTRRALSFFFAPLARALLRRDPTVWWSMVDVGSINAADIDVTKLAEPEIVRALARAPELRGEQKYVRSRTLDALVRRVSPETQRSELAEIGDPERAASWLIAIGPREDLVDPLVACLRALPAARADRLISRLASNRGNSGDGRPFLVPSSELEAPPEDEDKVDVALRTRARIEGGRIGDLLTSLADRRRTEGDPGANPAISLAAP